MTPALDKALHDVVTFLDSIAVEQGPSGDYPASESRKALELRDTLLEAYDGQKAEEHRLGLLDVAFLSNRARAAELYEAWRARKEWS